MREIEFRGWDKKLNIMWEGIEFKKLLVYLIFQSCPNAVAYESLKDHFNDIVWMEFTGLLDKNGKKIFEGDILLKRSTEVLDGSDDLKWTVKFATSDYNAFFDFGYMSRPNRCEVIGNIWENPEGL